MINYLDKIFFRSNNLDSISEKIKNISKNTPVKKIFDAINNYSEESEVRYVGGCIRKIINKEKIDDIDLATNLEPQIVCSLLKEKNIDFFESGISHGTVTASIENFKFEITTLREDVFTDGRHAVVKFSKSWKQDASRRDFTINSVYSDVDGNLFDPYDGKKDLEKGEINFIGDADKRIKEDYLRILRYIRFFLNYSKLPHRSYLIRKLKLHLEGVAKISKERLLNELKKITKLETLEKLSKDKKSLDLIMIIFPELKYINIFSKINFSQKKIIKESNFIFLISLIIIDETDNADYFLFKYKISNKDQKKIKIISEFYKENIDLKKINKKNMNKIFYYHGKQAIFDILNFLIIRFKKNDKKLIELKNFYSNKSTPTLPIRAELLMKKYKISEGKRLGIKLKLLEEAWVKNDFQISDEQIENIVNN